MNRSYRKIFGSGIAAALTASAMLMFVVCGDDKKDEGCGTGIGMYCYFPASSYNNNKESCDEIGTPCATGAAVSEATCLADYGYVINSCSNKPTVKFCDFGTPVFVGTDTTGGCSAIPSGQTEAAYCTNNSGTVVTSCPSYGPAQPGVQCNFGFNNIVVMSRARCEAEAPYAAIVGEGAEPFYCNFGQPTMYGAGGCYARFAAYSGSYDPGSGGPPCDPWSAEVPMATCLASNTTNGCIGDDPTRPDLLSPQWGSHKCCTESFATLAAFAAECSNLPGAVLQ